MVARRQSCSSIREGQQEKGKQTAEFLRRVLCLGTAELTFGDILFEVSLGTGPPDPRLVRDRTSSSLWLFPARRQEVVEGSWEEW